jgi:adenosylhomocysteine nucleosidase
VTSVGLIVALPGEKQTLTNARIKTGRFSRLNEHTLLCVSGIGPEKAAAGADKLIRAGCNALVSWGCAAAIGPQLKPGDLVVPGHVVSADGTVFAADPSWRKRLLDRLAGYLTIHTGSIAESATIVAAAADKRALRNQTGAIALDMESAGIAKMAARYHLPFVIIRAIADPASMDLPKPVTIAVDQNGDVRLPLLLALLIRYPNSIPDLIRLGICFRAAQRGLQRTARRLEYDFYPETGRA